MTTDNFLRVEPSPDGQLRLVGAGQLDDTVLERSLAAIEADLQPTDVIVVDLRSVNFIDSSVLGLFVRLRQTAIKFRIEGAHPRVRRTFDAAGLTELFEFLE